MTEVKVTRTVEEVTGYKAIDGTYFRDVEECKKYEESAKCVTLAKVKEYRIGRLSEYQLLDAGCDEIAYDIFRVENEKVFDDIMMYIASKIYSPDSYMSDYIERKDDFIGEEMIVRWNYDEDWCCIQKLDDILKNITDSYILAITPKEEAN